jgi:hypothetical protein
MALNRAAGEDCRDECVDGDQVTRGRFFVAVALTSVPLRQDERPGSKHRLPREHLNISQPTRGLRRSPSA